MKEMAPEQIAPKQRQITVDEFEVMTGRQMREYLAPLSFSEKVQFLFTNAREFVKLPREKRRELQVQAIENMEKEPNRTLLEKINLAFAKGALKVNDWLHKQKVMVTEPSPYLLPA